MKSTLLLITIGLLFVGCATQQPDPAVLKSIIEQQKNLIAQQRSAIESQAETIKELNGKMSKFLKAEATLKRIHEELSIIHAQEGHSN